MSILFLWIGFLVQFRLHLTFYACWIVNLSFLILQDNNICITWTPLTWGGGQIDWSVPPHTPHPPSVRRVHRTATPGLAASGMGQNTSPRRTAYWEATALTPPTSNNNNISHFSCEFVMFFAFVFFSPFLTFWHIQCRGEIKMAQKCLILYYLSNYGKVNSNWSEFLKDWR